MLLTELYNLGKRIETQSPENFLRYGFGRKKINHIVQLTPDGEFLGVLTREKPDAECVSALVRGQNIDPNFLWDSMDYVCGLSFDKTVKKYVDGKNYQKKHDAWIRQHQESFNDTNNHLIKAILNFFDNEGFNVLRNYFHNVTTPSEKGDNMSFQVGDVLPYKDQDLSDYFANILQNKDNDRLGTCSVTGKESVYLARLSSKMFTNIPGGRSTGTALYSNNMDTVLLPGMGQMYTSCISKEADHAVLNAYDFLTNNSKHLFKLSDFEGALSVENKTPKYYMWWSDSTFIREQFNVFDYIETDDSDKIHNLLDNLQNKEDSEVTNVNCHFLTLNGQSQRPHLTYKRFNESEIKKNLEDWFNLTRHESDPTKHYSIKQLIRSLTANPKSGTKSYKHRIDEIIQMVLFGDKPATSLISMINTLNRAQGGVYYKAEQNKRIEKRTSVHRIALMRACLGRMNMYNKENPNYLLGVLFNLVDELQLLAVGETNSKFTDQFYRSADSNTLLVWNKLHKQAEMYLKVLRSKMNKGVISKGRYYFLEGCFKKLILTNLNKKMKPEEYMLFALGKAEGINIFRKDNDNEAQD